MGTKQFASINQTQIDQIENNTVETGNLVTDVQSAVDRVEQSVQTIQDTDLSNVDTHVLTNTNKIDNVKTDTDALRATDIPNLQTDITSVKTDVANNKTKIDDVNANVLDIMGDTSRIEADTQDIQTKVQTGNNYVLRVETDTQDIQSRASRIETDTQDIQAKVIALEGTFRNNDEGTTLYGETLLNVTGAGVFKGLLNEGTNIKTIYIKVDDSSIVQMFSIQPEHFHAFNVRFKSSLKVNAAVAYNDYKVFYSLD